MIERRTICLNDEFLEKIKPFIKKHKGNFSSAIRELIEIGNILLEINRNSDYIDKNLLRDMFYKGDYVNSKRGVILPLPIFRWLLDRCIGELPSLNIIKEVNYDVWQEKALDVSEISYEELIQMIDELLRKWGWPVKIRIIQMNNHPKNKIYIEVSGEDFLINRHAAIFLIMNLSMKKFRLIDVEELTKKNILTFTYSEKNKVYTKLLDFFGQNQIFYNHIEKNMSFWKNMVKIFVANNYELALIHFSALEAIFMADPKQIQNIIQSFRLLFNKKINEVKTEEFLREFKYFCEVTRLFQKVEWTKNEVIIHHNYKNKKVIDNIKGALLSLFKETGKDFKIKEFEKRFIIQEE